MMPSAWSLLLLLAWSPASAQRSVRAPVAVRTVSPLVLAVPLAGPTLQPGLAATLQAPGVSLSRQVALPSAALPAGLGIQSLPLGPAASRSINGSAVEAHAGPVAVQSLSAEAAPSARRAAPAATVLQGVQELGRSLAERPAHDATQLSRAYDAVSAAPAAVLDVPPGLRPDVSGRAPAAQEKTGGELLSALHQAAARSHRPQDYDSARHYMFSVADNVMRNGVRGVVDAYSGTFLPGTSHDGTRYKEKGDSNGDGYVDKDGMNAEHVWPQSFFESRAPMRSDLHHLLPTLMHPNSIRGHLPFGEVRGTPEYSNRGGARMGGGVFEPPDAVKGRVARATLYFYLRYHDQAILRGAFDKRYWNEHIDMLLRWNRQFPPGEEERRRNDLVERFQGNRNPLVDDHTLADRVGPDAFRMAAQRIQGRAAQESFRSMPRVDQYRQRHHRHRHGRRRR